MDALMGSPWAVISIFIIVMGFAILFLLKPIYFNRMFRRFVDKAQNAATLQDLTEISTKLEGLQEIVNHMFSSYYPAQIKPRTWYDMLVYVHTDSAGGNVKMDSEKQLKERELFSAKSVATDKKIPLETEISIVPYLPDCTINPQEAKVTWYEDWHRVNFRVRSNTTEEQAVNGWIEFYAGPLLIAEMSISVLISNKAVELGQKLAESKGSPYESVFVSYAHKDEQIVELIEKVVNSLGFEYLRDVSFLKSGEEWNPAILSKIDTADVFQLCWSQNAKASNAVEQEWRHALQKQKKRFIRPCYWQKPMVDPPEDLKKLHFSYLDLSGYTQV